MGSARVFPVESALRLLPEALKGRAESKAPRPFPWQERLLFELIEGRLPRALDLPTGVGKTSVMSIWLLARAAGATLPRRLVYVVDRRAVVDQATEVADWLHEFVMGREDLRTALNIGGGGLPVSTLRGKHVDNRKWLEDPSSPAIIIGTVDMIGSRLLFEGYGVSWKMRPYHAGLLGVDSLFVLDEAHLVQPFERLLEAVDAAVERKLGPTPEAQHLIPRPRLLSLSATGRSDAKAFRLAEADFADPELRKRLEAEKVLRILPPTDSKSLAKHLAELALGVAVGGTRRVLVFCDARKVAEAVASELPKLAKRQSLDIATELFVGARRVYERNLAARWLRDHGFVAGGNPSSKPAVLVATSAAEVGVDLDADAAVMDIVEWERMVQRLGRVNRRGGRTAQVLAVPVKAEKKRKTKEGEEERDPRVQRLEACLQLLRKLPSLGEGLNASPAALGDLRDRWPEDVRAASTPPPLHPPLTRPLLEAWSMTSLFEHSGRPELEPWLRGWQERRVPETTIVFRKYLPVVRRDGRTESFDPTTLDDFFEVAGPHMAEELVVEVGEALGWLRKRVDRFFQQHARQNDLRALEEEVLALLLRSRQVVLVTKRLLDDSQQREDLERKLPGALLLVDVRLGGLENGLLAPGSKPAQDEGALDLTLQGRLPFRARLVTSGSRAEGDPPGGAVEPEGGARADWHPEKSFPIRVDSDGEPIELLVIERSATASPISEAGRSVAKKEQLLEEHHRWVEEEARRLARRLGLGAEASRALVVAARLHDEGKRARRWQEAFAKDPKKYRENGIVLAKSTRAPRRSVLGRYRHELGSLLHMLQDPRVQELDENEKDLALHLVAAHHGRARPNLPTDDAEAPPTKLRVRAREVALRFERLTRRYGPWGLAWLEALLRAADQQASRRLED